MASRSVFPLVLLFGSLLTVFGVGIEAEPGSSEPPPLPRPPQDRLVDAVVIEVLDGDSLVLIVDGQLRRYEIMGADAPEWLERSRRQRPYAEEARRFLTNMLGGEQVALLEPVPEQVDQLGRRRAAVFRRPDMALVDLEIVRQGYGRVSTRASDEHAAVLRWYETRARELGRGVWADPEAAPPPADETAEPGPGDARPTPVVRAPVPQPEPTAPDPDPADDRFVWITRSGSKYHAENCAHLTSTRTRVPRDSVESTHEPCKSCSPG
jgi:endonuclease YncB( thermonuclease family)